MRDRERERERSILEGARNTGEGRVGRFKKQRNEGKARPIREENPVDSLIIEKNN